MTTNQLPIHNIFFTKNKGIYITLFQGKLKLYLLPGFSHYIDPFGQFIFFFQSFPIGVALFIRRRQRVDDLKQ